MPACIGSHMVEGGVVVGSFAVSSGIGIPFVILHFFRKAKCVTRAVCSHGTLGCRVQRSLPSALTGGAVSNRSPSICRGSVSNSSPMFFPLPFPRSPQSSWYACRGWAPVPRCLATSPFGYWLSVSDPFPSPPPGSPCPTPYRHRPRPALPLLGPALLWVRLQQTTRGSCWPF